MIVYNLFALRAQLEAQTGRRWTVRQIAAETGLGVNTVQLLLSGETRRADLATLTAFWSFFRRHGLNVTPGDLFRVDDPLPMAA